ncbi:MAG: ethanolamine ammonia-lyase reactivating factor EutA [Desulfobacterales bacterium]|nr:ethanolamine ammonia-lyase reactivating factor EutA [Desulfobacterales bacterium]
MKESVLSAGIDIGTSTTQLVFSRITIENTASMVSVPRMSIVDKEVIYRSDIHFTPLKSRTEIDGDEIRKLIEGEYNKAGIRPSDLQTGAVIITGDTARKENASEVLKNLSDLAGDFVVATAGPSLEGIIAGKGAGADLYSREKGAVVANLDVGGGTTNIAVFRNGEVIDTACLDIGGRLIRFTDSKRNVAYLSDKIKILLSKMNINICEGDILSHADAKRVSAKMACVLEEVIGVKTPSKDLDLLITDCDLRRDYQIDYVTFSGGVADCIEKADRSLDDYTYGDIGILLGHAIADSDLSVKRDVLKSIETIRATVVGAGSHTTDISGSTITVTGSALPIQNIPVLKLTSDDEDLPVEKWGEVIKRKVKWYRLENEQQKLALAFKGRRNISFSQIQVLADSIIYGLENGSEDDSPLIIVVENDLAKALGQTLKVRLDFNRDVICIDTVKVENGDYIDIGRELSESKVVPVIVKTLLFNY